MVFSLDFLGFGSKRKTAFRILDREWAALDIDVRTVDNGVRQLLYQWTEEHTRHEEEADRILLDLAAFSGFLMRGPELAVRTLGRDGVSRMEYRLDGALRTEEKTADAQDSLDEKVIKLILAAGLADRDIEALVSLDNAD